MDWTTDIDVAMVGGVGLKVARHQEGTREKCGAILDAV